MLLSRPRETDLDAVDLDAVDLADPTTHAHGDPHLAWARMHRDEPVRWHPVGDELGFYSVVRYADVDRVLRESETFTSERGTLLALLGKVDPAGGRQMAATDPPKHTRMREPLQRALAMRNVDRHRDHIRAQVTRLLDPLADGDTIDFARTMAMLPMAVTGLLMDLPAEDWPRLTRLTWMSVAGHDPDFQETGGPAATTSTAHRELFAYFSDAVRRRQRAPGDDLISRLLDIEVDGERLDVGAITSNCYSLLLGANVTTPHVPSAAMVEMTRDPRLARDWAAHPELLVSGSEEAARWASPANHFMRYTTRETTLGGVELPAGAAVVVWLGAANRDPAVFPDPYRFDIRRRPNKHIAFGLGPHYCVGHSVARVSLRVAFEELLEHFEDFEAAGPPEHLVSDFVAGIKGLPLRAARRDRARSLVTASG